MNPESVDVTAGLGGFLAFFLLAVALYFLMRNMNTPAAPDGLSRGAGGQGRR